jgi:hypothetical protein
MMEDRMQGTALLMEWRQRDSPADGGNVTALLIETRDGFAYGGQG